ncbi:D-alanyl-D-alanine carboxypeptidase family protein [Acaryochloris sp. CCMEE 5410]|uniref:D-alanyl-D-alanine carboxypeptidase family protein n=1 Tax=Acaryochloris sp. CCMEE 5410 TaxID=310037 RepID=UPI00024844CE|nr:D-alanyl-D-alanine carboxypeptidase family protein [Acaryochloris sp. CCMEE 5410]KAI9129750.1 D-alanyl-D-alanine carboxypeptidase family protein [Acaryochloris sp. CCMEE 5410]
MKQKLLAFFLASLPSLTQIAPALAQQQQQTAALSPDTPVNLPGLYYDPDPGPSPTFRQLTTAEQAGYVEIPPLPNGVQLPYQIDRAWPQGATPDQILKFGDLQQNPVTASFTKLTLRDISARQGTDIAGVPIGDVPLVYGLTVDEVDNLYTKLNNGQKITVDDAAPAIQAALGVLYDPSQAGKQLQQAALTTGEKVLITNLSKIPAFKGIPLQDLARGNWEGVISKAEQIQLAGIGKKIGPTLKKLPVNQIVPLVGDAINGNWQQVRKRAQAYVLAKGTNVAVKEVIKAVPELKNLPLGAVPDLVNQPIEQTLPKIADLAIEEIPGAEDELVNSVPGLSDIPVNKLPFDLAFSFLAGDVFARFDIAYSGVEGPEEPSVQHALSGGTEDQKFRPIKCTLGQTKNQRANNCPHFEMRKFISSPLAQVTGDDDIEGKQWVQGHSKGKNGQGVKGGKGLPKIVNGGWEPAGIKPFGPNSYTKFVLRDIKEYPDKPSTAKLSLAIQFCYTIPILGEQCTPHFFVIPTPFTVQEGGLFLVASRRSLPAEIAKFRNRALTAAGLSQVYCDPNQIIASSGQSDVSPTNSKYGHLAYAETTGQLVNVTSVDGVQETLAPDAAQAFEQMRQDAASQGLDIKAVSGFRSVAVQQSIWDNKVASASPEVVALTSAPPGHSEHHTGLAVDVGNNQNSSLDRSWARTSEYAWMQANAGKYGFELSFPEGNSQGVSFEPWHWRFVGTDQAAATFSPTASNGQSQGTSTPATPADPDHNLRQYLARIRIGESSDGTNWKPNSQTGAYGIYQFTPESRQSLLQRTGIDGWTRDRAVAAQAAVEWIKIIGAEENVDLMAAIERGDFALADRVLSPLQWTSLPGGPEQSEVWSNPANFEKYGPTGDASTNEPVGVASAGLPCRPGALASNSGPGSLGVLTPEGTGIATGTYSSPLPQGTYLFTDYFAHFHRRRGRPHLGVDLGAAKGTPVLSVEAGTIDHVGWDPDGYGNFIVVGHPNGTGTLYAHLSEVNVRPGQSVDNADQIGRVGNTGRSRGDHLHFEFFEGYTQGNHRSGYPVDPEKYFNFR